MQKEPALPSGEWNGFYFEKHRPQRSWMHLYLEFKNDQIRGEGTDYVGPWHAEGRYDLDTSRCEWVKQYVGKHQVFYRGDFGSQGILGI